MKNFFRMILATSILSLAFFSCQNKKPAIEKIEILENDNLLAWCVVPFDIKKRNPAQRAAMLDELNIRKLAYDWRDEHLVTFGTELQTLEDHNIDLQSVWFWISEDSIGYLGESNEFIFSTLEKNNIETELWFSFEHTFFDGLSDQEKLDKAVVYIGNFRDRAKAIGCTLGLYNHGDWFGEPQNQIRIIEALGHDHIGIVYNFHHAHHQIDEFPLLLEQMQAYLLAINLNGMTKNGEKILALGKGTDEVVMIQTIVDSGYSGPIGILGHQDQRDVKEVLIENLNGLEAIKPQIN